MIDLNRARRQVNIQRHRARQYGSAINDLTAYEWIDVLTVSGGACSFFGRVKPFAELIIDHCISLSNGGNNTKSNIAALCKRCNDRKGHRDRIALSEIEVCRIEDDEVIIYLGGKYARLFDYEAENLLAQLTSILRRVGDGSRESA